MSKLYHVVDNGVVKGFFFHCPGCKLGHSLIARPYEDEDDLGWKFNGDENCPTFSPGVLSKLARADGSGIETCHFYVESGHLRFLNDCTHELAGKTVPMEDAVEED